MSVAAGDLDKIEADFLVVNARFANRRWIRSAHANGKEVYVWTVNDAPMMSAMISRGVDGLNGQASRGSIRSGAAGANERTGTPAD